MSAKSKASVLKRIDIRLTVYYATCVLLISGTHSAFLYHRLGRKLSNQVDAMLLDETEELLSFVDPAKPDLGVLAKEIERESRTSRQYQTSGRIISSTGEVLAVSQNFFDPSHPASAEATSRAFLGHAAIEGHQPDGQDHSFRMCTAPLPSSGKPVYALQLATSMADVDRALENFVENNLVALPAMVLVSIGFGAVIARRSLSAVGRINATAHQVTASRLGDRIPQSGTGDELDELVEILNMMLERLESSFQRVSQFSSDMAHELRTPVTTLRAATEVMLRGEHDVSEYQAYCGEMLVECDRLSRMIDDILLLRRSELEQETVPFAPVKLDSLLWEIAGAYQEVASVKGLTMAALADEAATVSGNESMLRRLLSNLIDNAIKYTPEGGQVSIELKALRDCAVVAVRDTGIGISRSDLHRVFDRFWRADQSRSRDSGGAGLGLCIAKSIAELHEGTIDVDSSVGKGSCFTVRLPSCEEVASEDGALAPAR